MDEYLTVGNLMSVVSILGALFGLSIYVLYSRHRNEVLSKDHIIVEKWPESGEVDKDVYPYRKNEIYLDKKAGKMLREQDMKGLETVPTFFVAQDAIGYEYWPSTGGIGKLMSVKMPKVMIWENDPEPMSRRRMQVFIAKENPETGEIDQKVVWVNKSVPIGTPELIGSYRNERFGLWSAAYERDIDEMKEKMIKVLATRIQPIYIYIAIIAALIAVGVSIYLQYQVMQELNDLRSAQGY